MIGFDTMSINGEIQTLDLFCKALETNLYAARGRTFVEKSCPNSRMDCYEQYYILARSKIWDGDLLAK